MLVVGGQRKATKIVGCWAVELFEHPQHKQVCRYSRARGFHHTGFIVGFTLVERSSGLRFNGLRLWEPEWRASLWKRICSAGQPGRQRFQDYSNDGASIPIGRDTAAEESPAGTGRDAADEALPGPGSGSWGWIRSSRGASSASSAHISAEQWMGRTSLARLFGSTSLA